MDLFGIETLIYTAIILSGILLTWLFLIPAGAPSRNNRHKRHINSHRPLVNDFGKKPADISVMEVFDYGPIKIMHENGLYTVNDSGIVNTFKSWRYLPVKYQRMVKDIDQRSVKSGKDGYFLDIINGVYHLTLPNGKTKRYDTLNDIPKEIRAIVGK